MRILTTLPISFQGFFLDFFSDFPNVPLALPPGCRQGPFRQKKMPAPPFLPLPPTPVAIAAAKEISDKKIILILPPSYFLATEKHPNF